MRLIRSSKRFIKCNAVTLFCGKSKAQCDCWKKWIWKI